MNAKQFFETVEKMREAQKNYFRTRSQLYLKESKQYEKEIDNEIKRANATLAKRNNPKLNFNR